MDLDWTQRCVLYDLDVPRNIPVQAAQENMEPNDGGHVH